MKVPGVLGCPPSLPLAVCVRLAEHSRELPAPSFPLSIPRFSDSLPEASQCRWSKTAVMPPLASFRPKSSSPKNHEQTLTRFFTSRAFDRFTSLPRQIHLNRWLQTAVCYPGHPTPQITHTNQNGLSYIPIFPRAIFGPHPRTPRLGKPLAVNQPANLRVHPGLVENSGRASTNVAPPSAWSFLGPNVMLIRSGRLHAGNNRIDRFSFRFQERRKPGRAVATVMNPSRIDA